jgi:hypothetical protein
VDLRDYWTGIALVCWFLWRHRDDIVLKGAPPSSAAILRMIMCEADLWRLAGLFRGR